MNSVGPTPPEPVKLEGFGPEDLYKRREKIFTRYVGGFFQKLRFASGWPLLLGYFGTPWLMWGDRQAILFDLPARQFHLLGLTIWPQDLWLLGWLLMIAAFGLFTISASAWIRRHGHLTSFGGALQNTPCGWVGRF